MWLESLRPWNARSLIRDRLNKQGDLARKSPLRKVPVKESSLKLFAAGVTMSHFHNCHSFKGKLVNIAMLEGPCLRFDVCVVCN